MMPTKLDAAAALERMDNMDAVLDCAPAFDFSALGVLSEQATEADRQFDLHYSTAQDEYLISCIYLAKVHELTAKAGRYGGGTWTKWYESKGLSEGSARTMVKNGDAFKSATVAELRCLPNLTRKDLNLIARSGCAQQLTEAAGDSQRVQELIAQLKAERDRADAAEGQLEAATADVQGLSEENTRLKQRVTEAEHECTARGDECIQATIRANKAEAHAREVENQLTGSRQAVEAARLRGDKLKAEVDSLKSQPTVAVIDKDEVERRAQELADAQVAEIRADLEKAQDSVDGRQAYDSLIMAGRSIYSIWMAVKPLVPKVSPSTREFALEQIIRPAKHIIEEAEKCL